MKTVSPIYRRLYAYPIIQNFDSQACETITIPSLTPERDSHGRVNHAKGLELVQLQELNNFFYYPM